MKKKSTFLGKSDITLSIRKIILAVMVRKTICIGKANHLISAINCVIYIYFSLTATYEYSRLEEVKKCNITREGPETIKEVRRQTEI